MWYWEESLVTLKEIYRLSAFMKSSSTKHCCDTHIKDSILMDTCPCNYLPIIGIISAILAIIFKICVFLKPGWAMPHPRALALKSSFNRILLSWPESRPEPIPKSEHCFIWCGVQKSHSCAMNPNWIISSIMIHDLISHLDGSAPKYCGNATAIATTSKTEGSHADPY